MLRATRLLGSESPKLDRPTRALVGFLMQKSGRFEGLMIKRDGYVLPFFSSGNVALTYWAVPDFADPAEGILRAFLRPGDTFVDVGANVGALTALAGGLVGRNGKVISIEPHPHTMANLQRTVAANGLRNVVLVNVACGAHAGHAHLTDEPRKDDSNRIARGGSGVAVTVSTLADLLRELSVQKVALLKVDVEGYEGSVLQGLTGEFHRIDALYVEVIDRNLRGYGSSAAEVVSVLQGNGFACFTDIDDPTNVVGLSRADQLEKLASGVTACAGNPPLS